MPSQQNDSRDFTGLRQLALAESSGCDAAMTRPAFESHHPVLEAGNTRLPAPRWGVGESRSGRMRSLEGGDLPAERMGGQAGRVLREFPIHLPEGFLESDPTLTDGLEQVGGIVRIHDSIFPLQQP